MASGDPRDPTYGKPLTTPIVTQALAFPVTQTVLNMNKMKREPITVNSLGSAGGFLGDDHYTTNGDLYHE